MQITREIVREFLDLYKLSPFMDNHGGIEAPHCFWVWYFLKLVNPEVVIESGVWKGGSTWLIEKTCPNAKIISIEPAMWRVEYRSPSVTYTTKDFNEHDWSSILGVETCKKTLAFIDDHQNNYERLKHAYKNSIGHMIFEDNYPTMHGDVLSLKKILSNSFHVMDVDNTRTVKPIPSEYKDDVLRMCEYFECPPVFLDTEITRWNDKFSDHNCKPPIFTELEDIFTEFKKKQLSYTFIAYVTVKSP